MCLCAHCVAQAPLLLRAAAVRVRGKLCLQGAQFGSEFLIARLQLTEALHAVCSPCLCVASISSPQGMRLPPAQRPVQKPPRVLCLQRFGV